MAPHSYQPKTAPPWSSCFVKLTFRACTVSLGTSELKRSTNPPRERGDQIQDLDTNEAAGAAGYLLKTTPKEELLVAIRNVHRGKKSVPHEIAAHLAEHLNFEPLSQREIEVLRHLGGGNRNRDIGKALFISEETVKAHVKHIMEKLGAKDRTHALAIGVRRGIIQI
jgi:DNA-binding NarL/FixJ family response regulator